MRRPYNIKERNGVALEITLQDQLVTSVDTEPINPPPPPPENALSKRMGNKNSTGPNIGGGGGGRLLLNVAI